MKYYDYLILNSDADSISLLYAPNGNLKNIAIGRDSIFQHRIHKNKWCYGYSKENISSIRSYYRKRYSTCI